MQRIDLLNKSIPWDLYICSILAQGHVAPNGQNIGTNDSVPFSLERIKLKSQKMWKNLE